MHVSQLLFWLIFLRLFHVMHGGCASSNLLDVSRFVKQLSDMRKQLGGNTDVDLWFPIYKYGSPFGQIVITCTCELECFDFDSLLTRPCRWRNELNSCDGVRDELDFIRMRGRWGEEEGSLLFGKSDSADGFFLITGVTQKLPETYSAMLVSDPIQCQQGDGLVRFRHWTTPSVRIRVCIRPPSMGKRYDWCSEPVKRNGTKMANVIIPGTITYMFEIVIEAYNFVLDAFGKQGGAAIIDDISYNASAIYTCQMIPHFEKLPPAPKKSCEQLTCDFDSGKCLKRLKGSGWKTSRKAVGPALTKINPLDGAFAYARGPGTYSFTMGPFSFPRYFAIEFCYYTASFKAEFFVEVTEKTNEKKEMYRSKPLSAQSKFWICHKLMLPNGTYEFIEFTASKLRNEHSYVAIDQIGIVDPMKGLSACK